MKLNTKFIIQIFLCIFCFSQFINAFFDSFCENVLGAKDVLKELSASLAIGLKTVGQTAKFLEKFVDSTLEEDCIYECPKSLEVLVPNPDYESYVNGCGSLGLHIPPDQLPRPQMVQCCNEHDRCYDSCGLDKEVCDKKFKRCLYNICDLTKDDKNIMRHKICQGGAKLLYTATMAIGCTSFKEAQSKACVCKPISSSGGSEKYSKSNQNRQEL